ncbi:hypothetical protein AMATHDRAFT_139174 [Amanita thiersii Skay4041]|uniref:Gamma interferon inducible lysosomal thiol reductase GILT n=1 Tax=Amanita thiersii Skay4041 TaxID=703135 RepID=A0A2A9NTN9_9AGAR|nr:hypothetical protein AMATHDRAFT_139174 [Amanita thiersii Skay4041]
MRLTLLFSLSVPCFVAAASTQQRFQHVFGDDIKVPVELGVMSRCPDALLCESVFNNVLQKVFDKVRISLRYVAKIDPSDPDYGVHCMHGPQECAGDVQQLCVSRYASLENWWEFVRCQNYNGLDKIGKPEAALKCADVAHIDWETSGAGQCAGLDGSGKGKEGIRLLQQSVILTKEAGISKSCTIVINGKKVCVHDGTWKDCENGYSVSDFVRQINEAYDQLNNKFA